MKQVREINLSYTVEAVILNKNNSKIQFGDNETAIDNVLVTGISIVTELAVKAPSGRIIFPVNELAKGFLTLANNQKEEYNRKLPLDVLLGNETILHIRPKMISLRNSFIDLPLLSAYGAAVPAGNISGWSIVMTFFYDRYNPSVHKLTDQGELIQ